MGKINVGVIGLGGISWGVHMPGLTKSKNGQIGAICDIDPVALDKAGDEFGIPKNRRFRDYRELISCPDVEAVDICTPNYLHLEEALEAIRCKKPFSVEKPIALCYEDAVLMEKAAAKAGLPGMVCFSLRFMPAVRFAKWIVSQGYLGEINNIYVQYLKASAFIEGRRLDWRFVKEFAGSGVIADLASHLIDATRLLGGEFTGVFAQTGIAVKKRMKLDLDDFANVETEDYSNFLAELDSGALATFTVSRSALCNEGTVKFEVYGSKGVISIDLNKPNVLGVCTGDLDRMVQSMHTVKVPQKFFSDQSETFIDVVKGKVDNLTPVLSEGVICQKIIDSLLESKQKKEWISIGS